MCLVIAIALHKRRKMGANDERLQQTRDEEYAMDEKLTQVAVGRINEETKA